MGNLGYATIRVDAGKLMSFGPPATSTSGMMLAELIGADTKAFRYENTYPGVACDIPSPLYTFTFDPNPDWSHYFAYGPEIQEYFEGFARRYG